MSAYLIMNPTRTGVVSNYRMAATNWWADMHIYGDSTGGFLYFPQFILFFTPFNMIRPEIFGEIIWRAFGFGLFSWALWRLATIHQPNGRLGTAAPTFLTILFLAVPASLAALNNGQTNLPLSASLVLAVLAIRSRQWGWAAFLLSLAVILKPIALAPWLLAFAVFPAIRKPLLLGLVPLLLLGFLHHDLHYATDRWVKCLQKIVRSYTPENLRVSDLFGMLEKAGFPALPWVKSTTRALACLGALAWVWQAFQKGGLGVGSWTLWVASSLVLTVFNPRVETNSYVLISPLLACAAVGYLQDDAGRRWMGWILVAACFGLMCDGMGLWIYKATDVWLKPLIVLLVSPLLFRAPEAWRVEIR